ncbi:MAG: cytochrome c3 family protein [Anaerolineales bacterium]|nr:MAG: cytochrome c3 family protein [Anaerolineales bacterium]
MDRRQFWIAAGIVLLLVLVGAGTALADKPAQETGDNSACLACHSDPSLKYELPSGELLSLTVDQAVFGDSVHGQQEFACIACHTEISGYPHPAITASDQRDYQIERYTLCRRCHPQQYELTLDSMHARVLASGNRQGALCTDCHGSHDIGSPHEPRQKISITCSKCHSEIFEQYKESVHGAALLEESNPDVPTCIDCHGVHNIQDPRTASFRAESPTLCAGCHADEYLMAQYGISPHVFDTYVADFHGTTLQLFEPDPDTPPRQAVCFDCHGVHDIKWTDDPESGIAIKENLLPVCRQCHPDAAANFPDAWMHHYEPSPEKTWQVYYTEIFFTILTTSVVTALIGHMVLDFARLVVKKLRG